MRFHATGLIVVAGMVLFALLAGALPVVAVVRVALLVYAVAAFVEVVVNMVRYRDIHVRSRLLRLLFSRA
jgi:cytochrome b subunit of formate dehydrogenase